MFLKPNMNLKYGVCPAVYIGQNRKEHSRNDSTYAYHLEESEHNFNTNFQILHKESKVSI